MDLEKCTSSKVAADGVREDYHSEVDPRKSRRPSCHVPYFELNKSEFLKIRDGHALLSSVAKTRIRESNAKTIDIAIANARKPYLNNEHNKGSGKAP